MEKQFLSSKVRKIRNLPLSLDVSVDVQQIGEIFCNRIYNQVSKKVTAGKTIVLEKLPEGALRVLTVLLEILNWN